VPAEKIAAAQDIPRRFLDNILLQLRRAGLIHSQRGPDGGYWLARPAEEITLADVIVVVEGGTTQFAPPELPAADVSYDPLAQLADTLREQLTPTAGARLAVLLSDPPQTADDAAHSLTTFRAGARLHHMLTERQGERLPDWLDASGDGRVAEAFGRLVRGEARLGLEESAMCRPRSWASPSSQPNLGLTCWKVRRLQKWPRTLRWKWPVPHRLPRA
jgi:hypothetical protein